ncbi:hypothetical protein VP01_1680g5 [Puccinia sorghi]|uniref:Uncharacterized protein n=1 Tax=Puccinia sorghi TaxID=27349 RepID=A0A0L6VFX5_9BASI|nr:hypothetical protein VP01_1680g5 [Puccinia sorghi]
MKSCLLNKLKFKFKLGEAEYNYFEINKKSKKKEKESYMTNKISSSSLTNNQANSVLLTPPATAAVANTPISTDTTSDFIFEEGIQNGMRVPEELPKENKNPSQVESLILIFAFLDDLCVFCDQPFPKNPSDKLIRLGEYLKKKRNIRHRYEAGNPQALHFPFSETAEYCSRHRAEMELIPMGLEKGWPSQIDFDNLHPCICSSRSPLGSTQKYIPSDFRDIAAKNWEILARIVSRYFMYNRLGSSSSLLTFDFSYGLADPFTPNYFVHKVFPDITCHLVIIDWSWCIGIDCSRLFHAYNQLIYQENTSG